MSQTTTAFLTIYGRLGSLVSNKMELSSINLINRTDFTKGFHSYRVQWLISDIDALDLTRGRRESPKFETATESGNQKLPISWCLCTKLINDNESGGQGTDNWRLWFGLYLITPRISIPIVFRLALISSKQGRLINVPAFAIFSEAKSNWGCFLSQGDKLDDDLVLRCWMDVPKSIVIDCDIENHEIDDKKGSLQVKAAEELQAGITELFHDLISGNSSIKGDVTLVIRSQPYHEYCCHSNILAARSNVFKRMFSNETWKECRGERAIDIVDIDKNVMEILLRYIYTSQFPDQSIEYDLLSELAYAADKYNLVQLKEWCVASMISEHYEISKRLDQFRLADQHGFNQLKALCLSELTMNPEIFQSDGENEVSLSSHLRFEVLDAMAKKQCEMEQIILEKVVI